MNADGTSIPMAVSMKIGHCIGFLMATALFTFPASLASAAGHSSTLVIGSLVDQSGFYGPQNASSYPLTATPYDFTGQTYQSYGLYVSSIEWITVTLTIEDGDSGQGEFDFGNLTLGLDGIDTGLHLDGFAGSNIQTLTIQSLNPTLQYALATALQDDQLNGSVLDSTPGNAPLGDTIAFPFRIQTEIELLVHFSLTPPEPPAVPLPAAIFTGPLAAGMVAACARKTRRLFR